MFLVVLSLHLRICNSERSMFIRLLVVVLIRLPLIMTRNHYFLNQCSLNMSISMRNTALKLYIPRQNLTHLSLVSLLWDVGKHHSPRCDAAECGVPSGAILFAQRNFIENLNKILKSLLKLLKMKMDSPNDNDW